MIDIGALKTEMNEAFGLTAELVNIPLFLLTSLNTYFFHLQLHPDLITFAITFIL